ncbi:MAG: tellurite resistance protein [Cellvibrionales bacterium]|nr:tellurite resistance protein [Cellvibrionales bacterium]
MKALLSNLVKYKSTPAFDQHIVPAGLLKAHQTKAGTWAKIVIVSGKLSYRILEPECEEWVLSSENHGVVESTILHEVAPLGEVQFYLDFYRTADA